MIWRRPSRPRRSSEGSYASNSVKTSWICSKLKDDDHILTSIDGPHDNVLVMKPPMCFSIDDADTFLAALEGAMVALQEVDLDTVSHTPT